MLKDDAVKNLELRKEVDSILKDNLYLNIATVSKENTPWQSTVFFAYQQTGKLTIYWYSPKASRHSLNIQENKFIAGNIYNSTALGSDIKALYLEGVACELVLKDILPAIKVYAQRMFACSFLSSRKEIIRYARKYLDFLGRSPMRFYKFEITNLSLLNPSRLYKEHYLDTRTEVKY